LTKSAIELEFVTKITITIITMKDFWSKQAAKGKMCFLAPMDGY